MTPNSPEHPGPDPGAAESKSGEAMRAAVARQLGQGLEREWVPPVIPDHVLVHRIGRGAYGDVWLARSALGTLRAVKVVYRARFEEDRPYEREFHGILKYEPISRTHEGLVQVLHVGRSDDAGCFYYVMELADNGQESGVRSQESALAKEPSVNPDSCLLTPGYCPRTLRSDLARQERLSPVEAAQFVLRLAGALAHLHARSLVHRDIKPANVIFVGGQPKLADIGLVTDVGSSRSFVGTEGFIPPEGPGTPQADLYGLGKLLYELATGRDRMDFPQLPARVNRLPDGEALLELNEVMTRACAPDPKQRYGSATELQAELNLFLAGRSLRKVRNIERHLARLKKFAAATCAFLALAAMALWFVKTEERHANERAREATERARMEATLRKRAEGAERDGRGQLYTALLEQARATVLSGELGQRVRALAAVRKAAAISNSAALRGVAIAALSLPDLRFERELPASPDLTLVNIDPKFERLALCRGSGPVEIRSVSDQQLLVTLPASTNRSAYTGSWSPDGRFLAVMRDLVPDGRRRQVEVWDVSSGQRILLFPQTSWNAVSFHPRLPRIVIGGEDATAVTWNLETRREISSFRLAVKPTVLRFSPDGERIAAVHPFARGWTIAVHNANDGAPRATGTFPEPLADLDWHPEGRWIAAPDRLGTVYLMDSRTGVTRVLGRHKADAVTTVFHPDGEYLLSGGWDRELICWDLRAMQRAFTIGLESYRVQFRADGQQCAVLRWPELRLQLCAFEHPSLCREFTDDLGVRLNHAAFSPDSRWLAASSGEGMWVWDLNRANAAVLVKEAGDTRLNFAANGELFANRRGRCFRWRVLPGTNGAMPGLKPLEMANPAGFVSLCLVSNGAVLTGARGSKLADFDELANDQGAWVPTVDGLNGVSTDGRWLGVFRSYTPQVNIHRLPGMERVAGLTSEANVSRFEFSPQGDEIAVASRSGVEFWSTATWQRTRQMRNYNAILYSPDGRTFWLASDLRAAALHDARTAEPLLPLPRGARPLAVSRDGRQLAVSVNARRLQVWDLAEARQHLRELGLDWAEHAPAP